ncbi:hypothetical protein D3C79_909030 [compost metagenome]
MAELNHFLNPMLLYNYQAVSIPDDDVTWIDQDIADHDGYVNLARLALVGALDAQPASKRRETHFDD